MSQKPTGLTVWQWGALTVVGALLVGLALLLGLNRMLGGLLLDEDDCLGTQARAEEISSVPLLGTPPRGARISEGWYVLEVGCLDANDEELLSATRSYEFDGGHDAVRDHYRTLAEADGWTWVASRNGSEPRGLPGDVCYEKELSGAPVLLRLTFDPGAFRVGTESALDDDDEVSC
ncbi:hypothetical protein ACSMX9_02020 [Streptomyces sp. LE64]|uniref:hypothetical protein n=1 Tax=Streptomyces sp. LE64 TaxID=3448653 RepID=UPI004042327B